MAQTRALLKAVNTQSTGTTIIAPSTNNTASNPDARTRSSPIGTRIGNANNIGTLPLKRLKNFLSSIRKNL